MAVLLTAGCRDGAAPTDAGGDDTATAVAPSPASTPAATGTGSVPGTGVADTVLPSPTISASPGTDLAGNGGAGGCGPAPLMPGVSQITVTGGGADHPVRVFVPSSFDGMPMPAVLNWHGLGSNGDDQAAYSGYEELAEEQGFLVVHPTGVAAAGGPTSWQLAPDAGVGRDDVAFAATLIDELVADWCAEPKRIYSTGMSNGGYFTTRLLCELSDRVAAGVSVAGLFHPDGCAPTRPVPLLAFHGTDDDVVPYEGGDSVLLGDDAVPPALAALFAQSIRVEYEEFVAANGCTLTAADTFIDSEIVIHTYEECDGGFAMALFEVTDGGHTWPGSPLRDVTDGLGYTTGRVEATRDGWVYMREFSLP